MTFIDGASARINRQGKSLILNFLVDIPFITHGFSTRLGGVSTGIFSSLNLTVTSSLIRMIQTMLGELY